MKRLLVACEFSGIVRDAFAAKGWDAWSCDLLPTERPGNHYQCDVFEVLDKGWDMMIAHPPCTYLSNAGIGYFNEDRYGDKARERKVKRELALEFFLALYNSDIEKVCVENPVGYANSHFKKPDQTIHPYFFGEPHLKRTCLWLRGLPKLIYTNKLEKPKPLNIMTRKKGRLYKGGEVKYRYFSDAHKKYNGSDGAHELSKTFQGVADAMADQWGSL